MVKGLAAKSCGNNETGNTESSKLFQVQLTHDAYPGSPYKFKETMQSFLQAKHVEVNSFPATFKLFEQAYNCMYIMTSDKSAQLGAELIPYRKPAFLHCGLGRRTLSLVRCDRYFLHLAQEPMRSRGDSRCCWHTA